jgi:16S rRNA processing protein RimM
MAGRSVCLGVIVGAKGLRGQVRVKSFTDEPADVAAYGALHDEAGERRFRLTVTGRAKGVVVARIEGIGDRDQAEALRGVQLFVDRAALPEVEAPDVFYHADLVGLGAEDLEGRSLGRVRAVHNFGAGDVIEIETEGGATMTFAFTRKTVPEVDLEAGRLVVDPPPEIATPDEGEV